MCNGYHADPIRDGGSERQVISLSVPRLTTNCRRYHYPRELENVRSDISGRALMTEQRAQVPVSRGCMSMSLTIRHCRGLSAWSKRFPLFPRSPSVEWLLPAPTFSLIPSRGPGACPSQQHPEDVLFSREICTRMWLVVNKGCPSLLPLSIFSPISPILHFFFCSLYWIGWTGGCRCFASSSYVLLESSIWFICWVGTFIYTERRCGEERNASPAAFVISPSAFFSQASSEPAHNN